MCPKSRTSVFVRLNLLTCVISSEAMHRAGRVEEHYGDLDGHYAKDRMASLIEALTYSANDKRLNRQTPARSCSTAISGTTWPRIVMP